MNIVKNILGSLLMVALIFSCTKFDDEKKDGNSIIDTGEDDIVYAPFSYRIDFEGDEDPYVGNAVSESETKALISVNDSAIRDLYVMQFNGTADNSILLSKPYYALLANASKLPLLRSTSSHRLVVVANIGRDNYDWGFVPGVTTYADFKKSRYTIVGDISSTPNGYVIMTGTWTGNINTATVAPSFTMRRTMAKIELYINNAASSGITIDQFQLINVPSFLTMGDPYTDIPSGETYPSSDEAFLTYDKYNFSLVAGASGVVTWYVPRNERGTLDWNPDSKDKNQYAPEKATYLRMRAVTPSGDVHMYSIYLGANLTNDFNLKPNKRYSYTINFNSAGYPTVDSRIEDYMLVDFKDKVANSYILNPAPEDAGGKEVRYRIYPTRVNVYWGATGYENSNTAAINVGTTRHPWYAELIWSDTKDLVTTATGDGNISIYMVDDPRGEEDYIEIIVPSTAKNGNFTVGLFRDYDGGTRKYKDLNEQYSWSWHFWVTDYNPDAKVTKHDTGDKATTTYAYNVPNGRVHRYAGAIWDTGIYKDAVIMDRNVGALSERQPYYEKGILLYQYGRKDPFPMIYYSSAYPDRRLFDINGNVLYSNQSDLIKEDGGPTSSTSSVNQSIAYPLTFYTNINGDWANDIEVSPYFKLWKDVMIFGTVQELQNNPNKSIFDPCPYGWQLPLNAVWSDFVKGSTVINDTKGLYKYIDDYPAVRYWPGDNTIQAKTEIAYGATGYWDARGTQQTYATPGNTCTGYWWSALPTSATHAACMYYTNMSKTVSTYYPLFYTNNAYTRAAAFSVRCVKLNN